MVSLPKAHIATRACACLSACFRVFSSRGICERRTSRKSWAMTELVSHLRIWRIKISHCYNTTNNGKQSLRRKPIDQQQKAEQLSNQSFYYYYYSTVICSAHLNRKNLARKHVTEENKALVNKTKLNAAASQSGAVNIGLYFGTDFGREDIYASCTETRLQEFKQLLFYHWHSSY